MKKKSSRKPPIPNHHISVPKVRDMARETKAKRRKKPTTKQDVNQLAARIVGRATGS
jgi:hypothetical protein